MPMVTVSRSAHVANDGLLEVMVSDDGPVSGVRQPSESGGLGLAGLRGRIESLGGVFEIPAAPAPWHPTDRTLQLGQCGASLCMNRIRIAVIDDHPLFRDGVIHTLRSGTRHRGRGRRGHGAGCGGNRQVPRTSHHAAGYQHAWLRVGGCPRDPTEMPECESGHADRLGK